MTPTLMARSLPVAFALAVAACWAPPEARGADDWIWVEGEKPARSTMNRHPYWYDMVKRDQLSGGDFLTNFHETKAGEAGYRVNAPAVGEYTFWVRANPTQARLSYKLNGGKWTPVPLESDARDAINIAADGKPDLRFLAWIKIGKVALKRGSNAVEFRMDGPNSNHGALDCFVLARGDFQPRGALKPGQESPVEAGWFAFDPGPDPETPGALDLRSLNESVAGEGGFIAAKGGQFVHSKTGAPVRFWAANGPAIGKGPLAEQARTLARRGVNLVRIHHGYYDKDGNLDRDKVLEAIEVVEAMKAEGIYSHFSIYFPLWLDPTPGNRTLQGYDGSKHPFAALFFDDDFQTQYRGWWEALLTTPSPKTGKRLVDEPAVMGLEIQNEDSFFFWTFNDQNIPDPELRILEGRFADWLKARHGSLDAAFRAWQGQRLPRDNPAEGRVAFRPLWNIANEKTARDKDTARFLVKTQRGFYKATYDVLRALGFKGVITASNWVTASPEVLGPLEKYSYTVTDFVDRHGYFAGRHQGEASEWSIRDGHTYGDRSALRFDPEEPGKPRVFAHPVIDPGYDDKPSMVSETTFNRPNRYRSEAPLYYAAYGALQDSDAIVHFAHDGASWGVKPGFFMQPWTLMSPAMMGQFPAAALIYRKGLISPGDLMVDLPLKVADLLDLKGTLMPQDAALDELRLKDVPKGTTLARGQVIDPLVHYVGRTAVRFVDRAEAPKLKDASKLIDRRAQVVASSHGQLRLDYGKGVLTLNAPMAQGASGNLKAAGQVELKDLAVASNLDLAHVVAVSLDDRPLATSRTILLQVMSEEKTNDFKTEETGDGLHRIVSIGSDPWLVRALEGTVRFKRADAKSLKVTKLDPTGRPTGLLGNAAEVRLDPKTIYYLIAP